MESLEENEINNDNVEEVPGWAYMVMGLIPSLIFLIPLYIYGKDLYVSIYGEPVEVVVTSVNYHAKSLDTAYFTYNGENCKSNCYSGVKKGDKIKVLYAEGVGFFAHSEGRPSWVSALIPVVIIGILFCLGLVLIGVGIYVTIFQKLEKRKKKIE